MAALISHQSGLPWCASYGELAFASAAFGAFAGSVYANAPLVFQESFPARVDSALGLSCALRAAGALLLAPLFDLLAGQRGGHGDEASACLWLSGGMTAGLMLGWLVHEAARGDTKEGES